MAFAVGFNISKGRELMENVAKQYNELQLYLGNEWETVYKGLQTEWVGEDEISFEKNFADRINQLNEDAYYLVRNTIFQINHLIESWVEFQSQNVIVGGAAPEVNYSQFIEGVPDVNFVNPVVQAHPQQITADMDRGLVSESSRSKLEEVVTNFVSEVKAKTSGLFESIEVNQAFFGDQTASIKSYVEQVGKSVGEVSTSVKDLHDALEQLTGTNYQQATSEVNDILNKYTSDVENKVSETYAGKRWE